MKRCSFSVVAVFFLLTAFLLSLTSDQQAADRRTNNEFITVMTLNAEFLWDGIEPEEGRVNFDWKYSQSEAEEHMEEISEIIIRHSPDIINLIEVENLQALTTLNDKFLNGRGYKPYLVKGKDSYTGQDVALLSRIDPENNSIERDNRQGKSGDVRKSVSKNYFAKFVIGEIKFALISLHFLAQPNREDRRKKREAQADSIRKWFNANNYG